MKKLFAVIAILVIALSVNAERVSYKQAEQAAKAYYHQTVNAFRTTDYNDINLQCVVNPDNVPAKYNLYIFDVNNNGYVVVSTDNQMKPVLAYSFECAFNLDNMSPGQEGYLKYYSECNDFAAKNIIAEAEQNQALWADLLAYNPTAKATRDVTTSPILLDGIVWEQGWPFNCRCPEVTASEIAQNKNGDHGRCYVGCVATSTSHVMKYWNWPESGTGSYSHSNYQSGGHGNHNINFANQHYDWSVMPDDPSTAENPEIGKICYHIGVAVKMYWGGDGSGSQTYNIPSAMKTYFKYKTTIQYKSKSSWGGNISDADWNAMLINEIDNRRPMIYSGQPAEGSAGHAWNCDGYQINGSEYKFHMQWGWGARGGNGFYTLDNLNSSATAGGEENNFCERQEAVIGIEPDTNFAECQAISTTGAEGSFDDGSRSKNYSNNLDCTYTINPECNSFIKISFSRFDLADGDYLEVYEGESQSLIATFDKNNLPPSKIKTSAGIMTLKFHTDGANTAQGWRLDYTSDACEEAAVIKLTNPNGVVEDGSKSCQYSNNKTCKWEISPANTSKITVNFTNFNVADDTKDYVGFYRNNGDEGWGNSNLIVKYNSSNLPTEPVTFNADHVGVKFYSNGDEIADGFILTYTSDGTGIEEIKILSNLSVVPNPASNDSRVAFTLTDEAVAQVTITNIIGQVQVAKEFDLGSGYHELPLSSLSSENLQSGMYFVSVKTNAESRTCKFIISK